MTDYIKREDALEQFDYYDLGEYLTTQIRDMLMDIPSADVAPVRHGRWDTNEDNRIVCSECKHGAPYMYKISDKLIMQELTDYCPYCGAFMDKEVD
jgi:hypothetical protein